MEFFKILLYINVVHYIRFNISIKDDPKLLTAFKYYKYK